MDEIERYIPPRIKEGMRWDSLSPEQRKAVGEYGSWMFGLASTTVADIDAIKYDGRLIILDDGSRWEVGSLDVDDVNLWSPFGKVVVLDDVMYRLEDAEHADVTSET